MVLSGVEWVLLDAVGTLIYADPPVAEAYHAVARRHGSRLSLDAIAQRFRTAFCEEMADKGQTSEEIELRRWRRIVAQTIDDVPLRIEAVFSDLWDHFAAARHWRVFDDVASALGELRQRGFRLGVASNFDRRLNAILAGHQALAHFEAVFVSSEVGYSKPQGQFFEQVRQRLQVAAGSIALVGDDAVNDAEGAAAAGWQAIWLCRDGAGHANSNSVVIPSLAGLL